MIWNDAVTGTYAAVAQALRFKSFQRTSIMTFYLNIHDSIALRIFLKAYPHQDRFPSVDAPRNVRDHPDDLAQLAALLNRPLHIHNFNNRLAKIDSQKKM